jgi:hypothetical protein
MTFIGDIPLCDSDADCNHPFESHTENEDGHLKCREPNCSCAEYEESEEPCNDCGHAK